VKGTRITLVYELPTNEEQHVTYLQDVHNPVALEAMGVELAQYLKPTQVRVKRMEEIDWPFVPGEKIRVVPVGGQAFYAVFQSIRGEEACVTSSVGGRWVPLLSVKKV
jgi:hypothetical protein